MYLSSAKIERTDANPVKLLRQISRQTSRKGKKAREAAGERYNRTVREVGGTSSRGRILFATNIVLPLADGREFCEGAAKHLSNRKKTTRRKAMLSANAETI